MTPEQRIAAKHLIAIWDQFSEGWGGRKTGEDLPIRWMRGPEEAAAYLTSLGLGSGEGHSFELNEAGVALLEEDYPR